MMREYLYNRFISFLVVCFGVALGVGFVYGIGAAIYTGHAGWLILAVVCSIILGA